MTELVGGVMLDYSLYSGTDYYSEGTIEDDLLEIAKENTEEEYETIISNRSEWSFIYHFSHVRANIIDWLPITKEHTVLEIGAGCGAITGKLSDMSQKVDCIELSKKRSLVNAYRNRNRNNITIKVGNFQEIEKNIIEKYDYITLIGVFEYAESYISSENSYIDFLKQVKSHLKEKGTLIIAIENKYGLKYWAGCKEDHFAKYFEGIEGYTTTSGVKTFSRSKIEELAEEVGFLDLKFYYPYPDYKLPLTIYSDEYLPKRGELTRNLCNFDYERMVLFDEAKVYDNLIEDSLYQTYANSYLVILKEGER